MKSLMKYGFFFFCNLVFMKWIVKCMFFKCMFIYEMWFLILKVDLCRILLYEVDIK